MHVRSWSHPLLISYVQIIKEKLAFPSGTATAQLISVLHQQPLSKPDGLIQRTNAYQSLASDDTDHERHAPHARAIEQDDDSDNETRGGQDEQRELIKSEGWKTLSSSFVVSGILTVSAYFFPVVFAIPLFGQHLAREWLWYFSPSLSYVGQGIIMGLPIALSMNAGMLVGWGILSPLAKLSGWAPGPVGDMESGSRGWILWIALAIMSADGLVSLLPLVLAAMARLTSVESDGDHGQIDEDEEPPSRLVPTNWVFVGGLVSVIAGAILVSVVFGEATKPWATVLGFILAALLSLFGYVEIHASYAVEPSPVSCSVRALGETDLNPVSSLGKASQVVFALLQPGNIIANIVAGGVAEAGAVQ